MVSRKLNTKKREVGSGREGQKWCLDASLIHTASTRCLAPNPFLVPPSLVRSMSCCVMNYNGCIEHARHNRPLAHRRHGHVIELRLRQCMVMTQVRGTEHGPTWHSEATGSLEPDPILTVEAATGTIPLNLPAIAWAEGGG